MGLIDPLVTFDARCKSAIVIRVALFQIISDRLRDTTWYLSACRAIKKRSCLISHLAAEGSELGSKFCNFWFA